VSEEDLACGRRVLAWEIFELGGKVLEGQVYAEGGGVGGEEKLCCGEVGG